MGLPIPSFLSKAVGNTPTPPIKVAPQPAPKPLQKVPTPAPISKTADDAAKEVKKPPVLPKKVVIGAGVLGGAALLSTGALGSGCESLMGANNCQFITAPEQAVSRLTGLSGQLAEGVVFVAAGAFVIGTTLLAHNMVGNGWLTAGTFTVSTFIAVGIVNRED